MRYLFILLSVILSVIFIPKLLSINSKKEYKVVENVYTYIDLLGREEPDTSEDIQQLDSLVETYERTFDPNILLIIGELYARGSYPRYSPDENSALRIYKVASSCPDSDVSAMAMSKMIETRLNPVPLEDRLGPGFPQSTANRVVSCAENHIKRLPLSSFMKKSSSAKDNKARRIQSSIRHVREPVQEPVVQEPVVQPVVRPVRLNGDQKQNVHSNSVAASLRANVKSLKEEFSDMDYERTELIETTMEKIRKSGIPEKSMTNIFRVLVSLVPDQISSIKCSQMDTLYLLTKKLDSIKDETLKKNAYETLGKNLESGIEHGKIVCSTGKVSRIISTLEGLDIGMQKSIPMDVVKKEIANLSSKVRTDILNEASERNRISYDTMDSGNLGQKMKTRLESDIERIYVKELGLSKKVLEPIISLYSSVY